MIKEIVINMEREINEFLCKGNFKNLTQVLKNLRILTNFLNLMNRLKVT